MLNPVLRPEHQMRRVTALILGARRAIHYIKLSRSISWVSTGPRQMPFQPLSRRRRRRSRSGGRARELHAGAHARARAATAARNEITLTRCAGARYLWRWYPRASCQRPRVPPSWHTQSPRPVHQDAGNATFAFAWTDQDQRDQPYIRDPRPTSIGADA
jgi:hypothetical protein